MFYLWIINLFTRPNKYKIFKKTQVKTILRNNKKPQWVIDKIIYFKAIMPEVSGYKIADIFNRKYQDKQTVSKSFVYEIIRKHQYAILLERSNIKSKKPYSVAPNKVWGIDLTGKQGSKKTNHHIFAIVEHNSRANLALKYIKNKTSLLLSKQIIKAIEIYGKPLIQVVRGKTVE